MAKILSFFGFLLLTSFTLFSQYSELSGTINKDDGTCDYSLKQFQVIQQGTKDSVLWSKSDTICEFRFSIGLMPGKYILRVRNLDAEKAETDFEIKIGGELFQLGNLILKSKTSELDGVTITGVPKKFIQTDAEKTIVTVEGNPVLEVSSVYDAILKIPGIIPYPGGGFAIGGQFGSVYFDGVPSSLSTSDMENLLKSLPANSVKKIEVITNPGASYDANFSGAIIDIISQGRVNKWFSGTVTFNSGFNHNQKFTPSFMLSGKGKKYTWQVQSGYTSYERNNVSNSERNYRYFDTTTILKSERSEKNLDQNVFFRPSFTYKTSKNSFLQLNFGASLFLNKQTGNSTSEASTPLLTAFDREGKGKAYDVGVKYRVFLDTLKRKMEVGVFYNYFDNTSYRNLEQQQGDTSFSLLKNKTKSNRLTSRIDFEVPFQNVKMQWNIGAKWTYFSTLSDGAYRLNDSVRLSMDETQFSYQLPFLYDEQNLAAYTELKKQVGKKFSATLGLRVEDFSLKGVVLDQTLLKRDYLNLFPSIHTLWRVIPDVMNFTASYSRKIGLPNYSQFDPNVSGYYDAYTQSTGNSALKPNFFHRSNAKITIFDYLQLSVDYTLSNSINLSEVTADSNSFVINQTFRTYENVSSWSYFFSLPVPFGFFVKGVKFFQEPIDVDAVSFVYLYAENNKTYIPGYEYVNGNKSQWTFGAYSQFILPKKIRLNVEYNYTGKGMFQLSETSKPVHDLELVLSREFKDDKWRVALTLQDVINSNRYYTQVSYNPLLISSYYKQDTRIFWIKVSHSFGRYERPSLKEDAIPQVGN